MPNAQSRVGAGNASVVAGSAMAAMTTSALVYSFSESSDLPVAPLLVGYGLSFLFIVAGTAVANVAASDLELIETSSTAN